LQPVSPQNPTTADVVPGPPVIKAEIEEQASITSEDLDLLENPIENNKSESIEPIFENKVETEKFPDETVFKYPLDSKEKTHYETILKANREAISSLRKQLQESLAENESLKAEIEASK
jgi:hypothetical protein